MNYIITVICFILIIGLVIFFHELGHFLLAKRNGIGVTEFSIGVGPQIHSFIKNGTRYSIRWLPFGGYCALLGQDSYFQDEEEAASNNEIVHDEEHYFSARPVWQRIAVVAAGPIFSFLLALLLALVLTALVGATTSTIGSVEAGYPAEAAGLEAGDEILKFNDTDIHFFKEVTLYMTLHEGETVEVTYRRNGETYTTTLTPQYSEEDGRYLIGIRSAARKENLSFPEVIQYAWYEFLYDTGIVIKSLGMLVTGKAGLDDLSGPVGMAGMVNEIVTDVEADTAGESVWVTIYWTFINLLSFTVLLSANLGVMNLIPIPAVDGGRLLILIIEAIRRKPLSKKAEGIITIAGVVFVIGLMVVVCMNDIRKVFF